MLTRDHQRSLEAIDHVYHYPNQIRLRRIESLSGLRQSQTIRRNAWHKNANPQRALLHRTPWIRD